MPDCGNAFVSGFPHREDTIPWDYGGGSVKERTKLATDQRLEEMNRSVGSGLWKHKDRNRALFYIDH